MIKLFDIYVDIEKEISVKGHTCDICMLTFSGKAVGEYFNGSILEVGVDTQTARKDGKCLLSARYMLEGVDLAGERCRIFIENNGNWKDGFVPRFVTDSEVLGIYEAGKLEAHLAGQENGVVVSVWADEG